MDPRQGHARCELFKQFHRREGDAGRAVGPRLRKGVDEVPTGIFLEALKCHRTPGRIADEALKLIPPMRWDLGGGVQGKPASAGTVDARECGVFTFIAKAWSNTSNVLTRPLA